MNTEIKISWFLYQSSHSTVLTGTETPSYPRGEGAGEGEVQGHTEKYRVTSQHGNVKEGENIGF